MQWFTAIDLYCERSTAHFWAEPLNALSNISFLIAAIWSWRSAIKQGTLDRTNILLFILAGSIGIGSFLFHTYANLWSSFADVIPIWSFIAIYVVAITIRLTGKSPLRIGGIAAGIIAIIVGVTWIVSSGSATQTDASTDMFNGSLQYAPALIAIYCFALLCIKKRYDIRYYVIGAAVVFSLSLLARSVDLYLCRLFPFGTHFLWHIFNGIMVFLLLQSFIRLPRQPSGAILQGS